MRQWRMTGWRRMVAGVAMIAGAVAVGGCASNPTDGYSMTPAHDASVSSVYVSMFQNPTFYHGLEVDLTGALVKELKQSTPWAITSQSGAQTTLSGTIVEAHLQPMSLARTSGLVQEEAMVVTIQFEWRDNRSGKVLVARRNFTSSEIFVPSQGVGERIETGQDAAVQKLAKGVVAELRSNW